MQQGLVFQISEGTIHDGPGLRVTVFMKGCMLRCRWCHSPEGQSGEPEELILPEGKRQCGQWYTADGLCRYLDDVASLLGDDGGITFSGGDPLLQGEFLLTVLKRLKKHHTIVETSGAGDAEMLMAIAHHCSLIHYGLKLLDAETARFYTGRTAETAVANLRRLDADDTAAPYVIRLPLLAGIIDTESNLRALMELAHSLKRLERIDFLPANTLAAAKYISCRRQIDPLCADCRTGHIPDWFDPRVPCALLN